MNRWGLLQSGSISLGLMAVGLSRQTKPLLVDDRQIVQNCLFRKIQRSPRPGLKQKASQNPGEPNFHRNFYRTVFESLPPVEANATLMESKLSDAQGQYFFWESVNKHIPETGLSQPQIVLGPLTSHDQ
jgi:hypothetical protein